MFLACNNNRDCYFERCPSPWIFSNRILGNWSEIDGVGVFSFSFSHYGPGVDSASNKNECQEYSCGVKGRRRIRADSLTAICEPFV
jgi:hypothetical protein